MGFCLPLNISGAANMFLLAWTWAVMAATPETASLPSAQHRSSSVPRTQCSYSPPPIQALRRPPPSASSCSIPQASNSPKTGGFTFSFKEDIRRCPVRRWQAVDTTWGLIPLLDFVPRSKLLWPGQAYQKPSGPFMYSVTCSLLSACPARIHSLSGQTYPEPQLCSGHAA